jgi:hypothetical protein
LRVGISALKTLRNGRVILETQSVDEIELPCSNINKTCRQLLETKIQKPRNPKVVIYNIPEEVDMENEEGIITAHQSELMLSAGEVVPKFAYRGKRNAMNMVIEVGPQKRQKIINTNLKVGWHICNTRD